MEQKEEMWQQSMHKQDVIVLSFLDSYNSTMYKMNNLDTRLQESV